MGRRAEDHHKSLLDLEHGKLPDPVAEAIRLVLRDRRRKIVRGFSQGEGV